MLSATPGAWHRARLLAACGASAGSSSKRTSADAASGRADPPSAITAANRNIGGASAPATSSAIVSACANAACVRSFERHSVVRGRVVLRSPRRAQRRDDGRSARHRGEARCAEGGDRGDDGVLRTGGQRGERALAQRLHPRIAEGRFAGDCSSAALRRGPGALVHPRRDLRPRLLRLSDRTLHRDARGGAALDCDLGDRARQHRHDEEASGGTEPLGATKRCREPRADVENRRPCSARRRRARAHPRSTPRIRRAARRATWPHPRERVRAPARPAGPHRRSAPPSRSTPLLAGTTRASFPSVRDRRRARRTRRPCPWRGASHGPEQRTNMAMAAQRRRKSPPSLPGAPSAAASDARPLPRVDIAAHGSPVSRPARHRRLRPFREGRRVALLAQPAPGARLTVF